MAGRILIILEKMERLITVSYKGWYTIKGKKYYFYRGTGDGAGVRAQNLSLTSADGLVSVFNKNGVCTKQYR
mgnify:CR=1 FL=1